MDDALELRPCRKVSKVPFVPYSQTGLVFSQIAGRQFKDNLRQDVVATGKKLGADAVLVGFIFRFRQRQGHRLCRGQARLGGL